MTRISSKLLNLIRDNRDFLIVTHLNPEGDAIGSSLALALGLKKMGKSVSVINRHPVPQTLRFLPASVMFKKRPPKRVFDVLFLVDCHTLERTGFKDLHAKETVIIDHHIIPSHIVGSIRSGMLSSGYISTDASATGELVYKLLLALKVPIDKEISTNLYTSIMVDTGGFRYSNTTPQSLMIASRLLRAGAEPWKIAKEVYESIPYRAMRLLALSFSTLRKKDAVAWLTVTRDMFKKTNTTAQDTENFVDYPRKINGVEVAALFREDGNGFCKVSLRSKGKVNVAEIAKKFGGGGHPPAAGCRLKGSLEEVRDRVLKAISDSMKRQGGFNSKPK